MAAIEDLLQGVPVGLLEQQCSDQHLLEISAWVPHWRNVSAHLGLSDVDEEQISHYPGGLARQNYDMLRKWKTRFFGMATYRTLANAFNSIGRQDLVDSLCNIVRKAPVLNQPTTDVPLGVVKYAEYLKDVYKYKPCGVQWPPVVSKCYVNLLAIQNIEDFPKEIEVTCTLAMIHSNLEVVKKLKRTIKIDQVGLLEDGKRARCIIVEGIPGIGKSTFCWHLGVCWAQNEILHDYHLVVLLRSRDKKVQKATEVSDLFCYKEQPKQEHEAVMEWIRSNKGDGVMMVLDGYDELSQDLQTSSIFADIIGGEVLPKMTVLVSSRPSANQNLKQLCQDQKCQYIEVIGFDKEEIQKYVDGALEHNKELRDELNSYLELHPHIHGLMYCPLNCAIIVQIFRDEMKKGSQPPQTLTEVYQVLIKTVLKRHEHKLSIAEKPKRTHPTPNPGTFTFRNVVRAIRPVGEWKSLSAELEISAAKIKEIDVNNRGQVAECKHDMVQFWLESDTSCSWKKLIDALISNDRSVLAEEIRNTYCHSSQNSSQNSLPITDEPSRFPWLGDVSDQTISQLLVLAKLAYEGINENRLIFQEPSGTMESLGLLQEVPELYLDSCGSSTYHFLHKTVQEFMAALHVSSLPPSERAEFVKTSIDMGNMTMVVRFMAGLTKLTSQDDVDGVLAFQKEGDKKLIESLHWLFEAHDPGLVQKCMGGKEWSLEVSVNLDPFDCYVLGYCITQSRQTWNLILTGCSIDEECIKMLMMVENGRAFDNIKTIYIDENEELGDKGAIVLGKMLRENTVLKTLGLRHCGLGPKGLSEVCSALEVNTTLTSLDLPKNDFDEQSMAISLGKLLQKNKGLTSLLLGHCRLGPEGLCEVYNALGVNTTLTSLDVSMNCMMSDDRSIASLEMMLRRNKVLTSLDVQFCGFGPKDICAVCRALGVNTTLTSLDLSGSQFDDISIASLGKLLRENRILTSLGLRFCMIGKEILNEVCSALRVNTTLTSLDLSWNNFDDQSIASLVTMLRENKVLTSLTLRRCGLSVNGLCEICNALGVNTALSSLNLSENMFDEQSIACLVQLLTNNKTLEDLTLFGCNLNDDALGPLVKSIEHSKLKKIYLNWNEFTKRGIIAFTSVLKNHPTLTTVMVEEWKDDAY